MSGKFTEDHVEQACLDWLEELGYGVLHGPHISPDGEARERAAYDSTILIDRFKSAFNTINPHLSSDACDYALRKLQQTDFPSLVEENRRLHQLMVDGVDVDMMFVVTPPKEPQKTRREPERRKKWPEESQMKAKRRPERGQMRPANSN